ncbi:hypothetical protein V1512DRAFT_268731 [Lipomyces arxii]|uniref:uncharacterized protein n=1 Tax=Lipomyces arxii TaxID=56418 RepID=UPI0034CE215A
MEIIVRGSQRRATVTRMRSVAALMNQCQVIIARRTALGLGPKIDWHDIPLGKGKQTKERGKLADFNAKPIDPRRTTKRKDSMSAAATLDYIDNFVRMSKTSDTVKNQDQPVRSDYKPLSPRRQISLQEIDARRQSRQAQLLNLIPVAAGSKWKERKGATGSAPARTLTAKRGRKTADSAGYPSPREVITKLAFAHNAADVVDLAGTIHSGVLLRDIPAMVPSKCTVVVLNDKIIPTPSRPATVLLKTVKDKTQEDEKSGSGALKKRSSAVKDVQISWHIFDRDLLGQKARTIETTLVKHAGIRFTIGKPNEKPISMDRKAEIIDHIRELCTKYADGKIGMIPHDRTPMQFVYKSNTEKIAIATGIQTFIEDEDLELEQQDDRYEAAAHGSI